MNKLKSEIEKYARQLNVDVNRVIEFYDLQREKNRKRAYERAVEYVFNENQNARCHEA